MKKYEDDCTLSLDELIELVAKQKQELKLHYKQLKRAKNERSLEND